LADFEHFASGDLQIAGPHPSQEIKKKALLKRQFSQTMKNAIGKRSLANQRRKQSFTAS
jgi:hypothetical protein